MFLSIPNNFISKILRSKSFFVGQHGLHFLLNFLLFFENLLLHHHDFMLSFFNICDFFRLISSVDLGIELFVSLSRWLVEFYGSLGWSHFVKIFKVVLWFLVLGWLFLVIGRLFFGRFSKVGILSKRLLGGVSRIGGVGRGIGSGIGCHVYSCVSCRIRLMKLTTKLSFLWHMQVISWIVILLFELFNGHLIVSIKLINSILN